MQPTLALLLLLLLGALPGASSAPGPRVAPGAGAVTAAEAAALAEARAARLRCVVVIDRHNHKTGGSTMRGIFNHLQASGKCLYWGYGPQPPYWEAAVRALEETIARGGSRQELLRLCVELHFPVEYWENSLPRLTALRDRAATAGSCRVVLVTRVRDPLAFYLSYWRWTIMGKQISALECIAARAAGPEALVAARAQLPLGVRCGETPSLKQPEDRFGFTFIEWVRRTPNLQSRLLLRASASSCVEEPGRTAHQPDGPSNSSGGGGARASDDRCAVRFGEAELGRLFALLDAHDIVGTVRDFDAHLLLLQELTGWEERDLNYVHVTPVYRSLPKHHKNRALPFGHEMVCADRAACEAAVAEAAPMDFRLWARYGATFNASAAERLGGAASMRARLDAFRARNRALASLMANGAQKRAGLSHGLHSLSAGRLRAHLERQLTCSISREPLTAALLEAEATPSAPQPDAAQGREGARRVTAPETAVSRDAVRQALMSPGQLKRDPLLDVCMPVPARLARIWQASGLGSSLRTVRPRALEASLVGELARWAVAHATQLAAAGLPILPAACTLVGAAYRCGLASAVMGPQAAEVEEARARLALAALQARQ